MMETPVLVRSLKSSNLSLTSLQMDKTFWGVMSVAVGQSRRKANMVAQGNGKFGPWGWPQNPSKPKKKKIACQLKKARKTFLTNQAHITWTRVIIRVDHPKNISFISELSYLLIAPAFPITAHTITTTKAVTLPMQEGLFKVLDLWFTIDIFLSLSSLLFLFSLLCQPLM